MKRNAMVQLAFHKKSHLSKLLSYLFRAGWDLEEVPAGGKIPRNGLKLWLKTPSTDIRLRLFVYKVTGSSRARPEERRIEITTTYVTGLRKVRNYPDLVLGYSYEDDVFVGVDPRRLGFGGKTHNASSFFDIEGLDNAGSAMIEVRSRELTLFPEGLEYHAFLRPPRLAEYLFNREEIHTGNYLNDGYFSGVGQLGGKKLPQSHEVQDRGDALVLSWAGTPQRHRSTISGTLAREFEANAAHTLRRRKVSLAEFRELRRRMEENGQLGEEYVLRRERERLRAKKRSDLARRVKRVSEASVGEGYDIRSFEENGKPRYIEVKATSSSQKSFEMSTNEWQTCLVKKDSYFVYFVTNIRRSPHLQIIQNPAQLDATSKIKRTCTGWRITLA